MTIRGSRGKLLLIALLALVAGAMPGATRALVADSFGQVRADAVSLDGHVELAWQSVPNASAYVVYRGASPTAITDVVSPAGGVTATTMDDTTAMNGMTYYYSVHAVVSGTEEAAGSPVVQASPVPRSCSAGNPIVLENCYPGNTRAPGSPAYNVTNTGFVAGGGIEGYATATSIEKGESVDLKVNADNGTAFRLEIYRSGYYGGDGARLFSVVRDIPAVRQPSCVKDTSTGLTDCSNWSASFTLSTTASWPTGVYVLKLIRSDTGTDNQILVVVRDDGRSSNLLYGVPFATYQAYNAYGGKSLYSFNSTGAVTVAGTPRAVKVSYDRPFEQPRSGLRDWYTRTDTAMVSWLEREGYDITYTSNTDLERTGAGVLSHKAYVSAAHDEYVSTAMRTALENARDAGVNLFFSGSNEDYWKIRFENSPVSGGQDRVEVCYKSTESGSADPSGIPTGTWRDPAGANRPENSLSGVMYVGDKDLNYFPLVVSAAQGADRVYRYTGLDTMAAGTTTSIGSTLVGWEWDSRVANGQEPANVKTLAASPVTGNLIQGDGAFQTPGSATVTTTKYTAPSGALVFATATNHWSRGLALNAQGTGEPNGEIQQITTNVLADMAVLPLTPAPNMKFDPGQDPLRPPAPTGLMADMKGVDHIHLMWDPVPGTNVTYHVYRTNGPRQGGQPLGVRADATDVTGTEFLDLGLASNSTYYYAVTAVKDGKQSELSPDVVASTLPGQGDTIRINAGGPDYTTVNGPRYTADAYFTGGNTKAVQATVAGTNDSSLYQDERWGDWSYAVPVPNGIYDVRLHFAELYYGNTVTGGPGSRLFGVDIADTDPYPDLPNIDIYAEAGPLTALVKSVSNVMVMDGTLNIDSVRGAADDPEITAIDIIPATTIGPPTATETVPTDASTDVSRQIRPRVTFSRAMDSATITASSFTLKRAGGTAVPATVTYDAASNTATLDAGTLDYATTYTATVDTTAMSTDGQMLASPVTWTFTTQAAIAPQLQWSMPMAGDVGVSPEVMPHVGFTRPLDPATVSSMSVHLHDPADADVMADVTYDETQRVVMIMPMAPLALSTTYTVRVDASVTGVDGVPLANPILFSFTTAATPPPPPTVTATTPADGATAILRDAHVTATFSRDMSAEMFTGSIMTLSGPNGRIAADVGYDPATRTGTLVPTAPLDSATTYTAKVAAKIHASDGTPLGTDYTWSFTTATAPTVTATTPLDGSSFVTRGTPATASFSRAMNGTTMTSSSFTVKSADGSPVNGSVSYDGAANVATFNPSRPLAGGTLYTAKLDTTVTSADGTPLSAPVSWSFRTQVCPCTLFSSTTIPARTNLDVRDNRTGIGPWSYELGVKVKVDQPMKLTAIRFYKNSRETGTHVGRVWTTSGVELAQTTFANETASGWQQQALPTPLSLQAGTTYIVSANANAFFGTTQFGLQNQVVSGPLRSVVDPKNGIYGSAAGVFPTSSFSSTNYFTDVEVMPDGNPLAPTVVSSTPAGGSTGVARDAKVKATFSRPVDPATVDGSTFTLRDVDGSLVPATVSYDDGTSTATLTPSGLLNWSATYNVKVSTGVRARDGMPLAAAVESSFKVLDAVPVTVVRTIPANGDLTGTGTTVRVEFSKPVDPATVNTSTFTLQHPMNGMTMDVSGVVTYDAATNTATFTPDMPLMENSMLYTVHLDAAIKGTDASTLAGGYTFQFTTLPVDPPTVTSTTPAGGANFAARTGAVKAVFNRGMDPTTITTASYTLKGPDGVAVAAKVGYDDTTKTATLTPNARLTPVTTYTATLDTTVKAADAVPLPAAYSWSFTTAACPCSLFSPTLAPVKQNISTKDGRTGTGPWSYEMGVKVKVDEPMQLSAIRFWKSSGESGTHVGTVWTSVGTKLTTVTFTGESGSGWQQQALPTPLVLQPGAVYVVSVNRNAAYEATTSGLATQVVSGPLRSVADGKNGVYGASAGTFPSSSFSSTNYFADVEVVPDGDPGAPGVVSSSPAGGSTGVAIGSKVTATFSRPVDPATVNGSTVTLKAPDGSTVPATVAYDDGTSTATLTPSSPLGYAKTYAAHVAGVRARDGMPMASAVDWTFTTADLLSQTLPPDGSSDVGVGVTPRAVFTKSLDPTTVTATTFTLTASDGSAIPATVAYEDASKTATLTPTAALAQGSTYTARLDASIKATDGTVLGRAYSWSFSTTQPPLTTASTSPAAAATGVQRDAKVTATFSRALDPATLNGTTFRLKAPDGSVVPATTQYDSASLKATLSPSAALAPSTTYTADLTSGVKGVYGSPLVPTSWTFTTGACPCSLFADSLVPTKTGNTTQDGRVGTGPWSYEFGVKIAVDDARQLSAIRFWKDPKETGVHTGTVWTAGGTKLATVTFAGETASGWQTQALATPVQLQAGTTYVVSVNANASFGSTQYGLQTPAVSGPLHSVAVAANGVYGSAAGVFPTSSFRSSNYFVDAVVR